MPLLDHPRLIAQTRAGDLDAARELALDARRRGTLHPLLDALFGPLPHDLVEASAQDPSPTLWRALTRALDDHLEGAPAWTLDVLQRALDGWPDATRACPTRWIEAALDGDPPPALSLVRALDCGELPRLVHARTESHRLDALTTNLADAARRLLSLEHLRGLSILTGVHAGPRVEGGGQPSLDVITDALPPTLTRLELHGVVPDNAGALLTWLEASALERLTLTTALDQPSARLAARLARLDAERLRALATDLFLATSRWDREAHARVLQAWGRGPLRRQLQRLDFVGPRAGHIEIQSQPTACIEFLLRTTWPALRALRVPIDVRAANRILSLPSTFLSLERLELYAATEPLPQVLIDELDEALPDTTIRVTTSPLAALHPY